MLIDIVKNMVNKGILTNFICSATIHITLRMVPFVAEAEFQRLVDDIKQNKQYYKIVVYEDGVILDVHHRYKACRQLGIDVDYEVRSFPDKLTEKEFVMISKNLSKILLT